jgi:glutamate racemase
MSLKIGVFDSGVGGMSVANAIQQALPDDIVYYTDDQENIPYGNKSPDQLLELVLPILEALVNEGCQAIVIACNTVSTTIVNVLRDKIPVPIIALEPMVKPATEMTKTKKIAVCATPTTLASSRYNQLKTEYAAGVDVIEPDCSDWASMIQDNKINHGIISQRITDVCKAGADVIVLGCTHYHWIEEDIQIIANKYGATVIQPEQAIINRLKTVISEL